MIAKNLSLALLNYVLLGDRASASIKINLTQVSQLGAQWNDPDMVQIVDRLNKKSRSANVGLNGNRMFYDNDYMVRHF